MNINLLVYYAKIPMEIINTIKVYNKDKIFDIILNRNIRNKKLPPKMRFCGDLIYQIIQALKSVKDISKI